VKALFIVDDVHGQGHVVRSGALRDELERRGWKTKTALDSFAPLSCGFKEPIIVKDVDVIVSDGGHCIEKMFEARTVYIADEPSNLNVTLLVAGGAGATEEMYKDCGAKKVLAGPQYALLRPEFRDRHELMNRCFAHVPLVKPPLFDIRRIVDLSADQLAAQLFSVTATAGIVITHGGMRAMECACVGAPMVIVPRNEGERLNARALRIAGAALIADEKSAEQVAKDLLEHPRWLQVMSKRGRELVDGLGVKRVADAIEELVK
jgi:spore coat polysaccharide biosynthesis predicted glycosyltransferase SpsG